MAGCLIAASVTHTKGHTKMHGFEWIMRAAKNSKPSDTQLAEWAKQDAENAKHQSYDFKHPDKTPRSALTGWDGYTISIDDIQYANEYAEPGYTNPETAILFGNWNSVSRRVFGILERAGYACEWDDEWSTCDECGKAVRTSQDSYGWQPSFAIANEYEMLCHDCLASAPESYLLELEDNPHKALNLPAIKPAEHGYTLLQDRFESGFHPEQNDKPEVIYKQYKTDNNHLLFAIDSVSQFDINFSVWERIEK
jgi:hypothetical protein